MNIRYKIFPVCNNSPETRQREIMYWTNSPLYAFPNIHYCGISLYWYVYSETRPSYNSTNKVIAIPKQPIFKLCYIPFTNVTLFTYHLINKCPWPHLRVILSTNVFMLLGEQEQTTWDCKCNIHVRVFVSLQCVSITI